jgi:hypothetical protein
MVLLISTGFCLNHVSQVKLETVKKNPEQGPTVFYFARTSWILLNRQSSNIKSNQATCTFADAMIPRNATDQSACIYSQPIRATQWCCDCELL